MKILKILHSVWFVLEPIDFFKTPTCEGGFLCYNTGMKPVIKYQGGKSKELSRIKEIAPKTILGGEPFCGGSAVSLHYGDTCVLNDINKAVINLYREAGGDNYSTIQRRIDEIKTYGHDELSEVYYSSRDIINDPDSHSNVDRAIAYIVMRQLCFQAWKDITQRVNSMYLLDTIRR